MLFKRHPNSADRTGSKEILHLAIGCIMGIAMYIIVGILIPIPKIAYCACIICILITFAKSAYRLGRFVKNQGEEVKQEDGGEESLLVMELAIAGEAIMFIR